MSLRLPVVVLPLAVLIACTTAKEPNPPAGQPVSTAKPVLDAYVDAWNRRDSAAFDTLMAADGTHEDISWGFLGHGPAGAKELLRGVLSMEPDFEWKLTDFVENGSNVAAEWTWTATYTGPDPAGKPVKNLHVTGRGVSFVQVEGGKIKKFTDYYDGPSFFPKPAADTTKKS